MRVLALASLKGGSSKSTTAANLAALLASPSSPVLAVDADPQGTLSRMLGASPGPGLAEVLTGAANLEAVARPCAVAGVELVAASPLLAAVERRMAAASEQAAPERRLLDALARAPRRRWQLVVVDTPPGLNVLTLAGLVAADDVLAVATADPVGASGVPSLVAVLEELRASTRRRLRLVGVLVGRVNNSRSALEALETLRREHGRVVLRATVRESRRVAGTPDSMLPVVVRAPRSPVAQDFHAAARELRKRLNA